MLFQSPGRAALLALVIAILSGCGGGGSTPPQGIRPKTARVTWFGNQCFLITSSLGTQILINPYAPGTGGRSLPKALSPDVLLITHERRDANYDSAVENFPAIFRGGVGMGTNNAGGVRIRGTPTGGGSSPLNLVFSWNLDGMKVCFPGDIAGPLQPGELAQIGKVDVLFLPVSGRLSAAGREGLIAQLQPKVIIPMGSTAAVESWATTFPTAHRIGGSDVLLNAFALPSRPTALILSAR